MFQHAEVAAIGFEGETAGQQVVTSIPVSHLDDITDLAKVFHVFLQNDFHNGSYLRQHVRQLNFVTHLESARGIRQQSDRACLLDGGGELTLMPGARASDTARNNFSPVRDKVSESAGLFKVDQRSFVRAKSAHFAAYAATSWE